MPRRTSTTTLNRRAALLSGVASVTLHNAGSGPFLILVLTITPTAERATRAPSIP